MLGAILLAACFNGSLRWTTATTKTEKLEITTQQTLLAHYYGATDEQKELHHQDEHYHDYCGLARSDNMDGTLTWKIGRSRVYHAI